jgi:DNA-binding CsgD family transcriptional regulator
LLANERETPSLSDREAEVLGWIAAGKSNTDIGTILGISAETVRTYTQRIYMKLDAYDRTSAVVRALKLGVLRNPGQ